MKHQNVLPAVETIDRYDISKAELIFCLSIDRTRFAKLERLIIYYHEREQERKQEQERNKQSTQTAVATATAAVATISGA